MPNSMFDAGIEALLIKAKKIAEIALEELKTPQGNLCMDDEALKTINWMLKDLDKRLEMLQQNTTELADTIERLKIVEQKDYIEIYG